MCTPNTNMITFDPEIGWNTIVQVVGFAVGIGVVWWQLYKQRKLQKENHLIQIKKEIYKEATDRMEHASPAGVALTLNLLIGLLEKGIRKKEESGKYQPPPLEIESIRDDFKEVHKRLSLVGGTLEKYEIINQNQPLFRKAFNAKVSELVDAFIPILSILPYLLLSKDGINDPDRLLVPNEVDMKDLKEMVTKFLEFSSDIDSFLYDIQVETQNILLGELFNRKVQIRKPLDDKYIILTSQCPRELEKVENYLKQRNEDIIENLTNWSTRTH